MLRQELSQEDAARILAGSIRNMVAAPGPLFSPWVGLDLSIRDGVLYRTSAHTSHFDRPYVPIAEVEELLALSDEEIMRRVTGERA